MFFKLSQNSFFPVKIYDFISKKKESHQHFLDSICSSYLGDNASSRCWEYSEEHLTTNGGLCWLLKPSLNGISSKKLNHLTASTRYSNEKVNSHYQSQNLWDQQRSKCIIQCFLKFSLRSLCTLLLLFNYTIYLKNYW